MCHDATEYIRLALPQRELAIIVKASGRDLGSLRESKTPARFTRNLALGGLTTGNDSSTPDRIPPALSKTRLRCSPALPNRPPAALRATSPRPAPDIPFRGAGNLPLDLDPQLVSQSPSHPQLRTPPRKIPRNTHDFLSPFSLKSPAISWSQTQSPAAAPSSRPAPARSPDRHVPRTHPLPAARAHQPPPSTAHRSTPGISEPNSLSPFANFNSSRSSINCTPAIRSRFGTLHTDPF